MNVTKERAEEIILHAIKMQTILNISSNDFDEIEMMIVLMTMFASHLKKISKDQKDAEQKMGDIDKFFKKVSTLV